MHRLTRRIAQPMGKVMAPNKQDTARVDTAGPALAPLLQVEQHSERVRRAATGVRPRTAWAYGGLTVLLLAAYPLVGDLATVIYGVLVLATLAAIVVGVVRNRPRRRWPWLLLAAGYLAFAMGTAVSFAYDGRFPSPGDAIFLGATLPLVLAGLLGLARTGARVLDRASAIDAVILTTGAGFLAWVFLIDPFLHNPSLTATAKAVSVAYPLTDLMMLVLLTRLGLGRARTAAATLLIVSGLGLLTSDSVYGLIRLYGDFAVGTATDLGWLVFLAAAGLAALHPSMVRLTEPQVLTRTQVSLRRGVLTVACLLAPAALLIQALRGPVHDGVLIAAVSAGLILLALARMSAVAASLRRTTDRERRLREACEALLRSSDIEEVADVLHEAVGRLLAPGTDHRVLLTLGDHGPDRMAVDDVSALTEPVARQLTGFELALHCPLRVGETRIGELVVAAGEAALAGLQESVPVLAGQAATMIDRIRLNREVSRQNSQAYFRTLVVNASEVIAIVADDNRIGYVSPAAETVFGTADLAGRDLIELIEPKGRPHARAALDAARAGGTVEALDPWPIRRTDGRLVQTEVTIGDMRAEEGVNGLVVVFRDVTERIRLERELIARAYVDPLTGLGNRLRFTDDVATAARAARKGRLSAVLMIDIDDFRTVNDTMGHAAGDELLVALGRRLTTLVADRGSVYRLGGDEFGAVVSGTDLDAVERLATRIVAAGADGFALSGGPLTVQLRLGVATTLDASSAAQLLGQADVALTAAAAEGGARWRRYEATLHAETLERNELRAELARAVAEGAFALNYQPIVELGSGRTAGFEALLRWPHPTRGLVSPVIFIPLAEESGLILELGAWVLRTAVEEAASWTGLTGEPPYVSVNVSVRQFRSPDFVDRVLDEVRRTGLRPDRLTLEITESLLLGEHEQIPADIARLRSAGIKVSIDDFGTGYSSLSYLHRVPIDTLKLDKSFVDTMTTSARQHDLVRGIIQMAGTLSLSVVAEGVETEDEHRLLLDAGCDYGQGYLFARPLTPEAARARITGPDPS
jgi:diguanylate cyclase (GGDEF)-like protein/PAS domain S-box-containing protein